jgi:hypothetical protein
MSQIALRPSVRKRGSPYRWSDTVPVRPLREGVMQVGRHRLSLFRAVQDANDA